MSEIYHLDLGDEDTHINEARAAAVEEHTRRLQEVWKEIEQMEIEDRIAHLSFNKRKKQRRARTGRKS